jgi:hypothetical protein
MVKEVVAEFDAKGGMAIDIHAWRKMQVGIQMLRSRFREVGGGTGID